MLLSYVQLQKWLTRHGAGSFSAYTVTEWIRQYMAANGLAMGDVEQPEIEVDGLSVKSFTFRTRSAGHTNVFQYRFGPKGPFVVGKPVLKTLSGEN